jgi:Ras GTPase-activating-like protein IQGAP2/3
MSEHPTSSPKGIPSSPSIFAYQTRLLQRTSSTTNNSVPHHRTPGSTSASNYSSLAEMAKGDSPSDTPIRRNVARMAATGKDGNEEGSFLAAAPTAGRVGLGLGLGSGSSRGGGHSRNGRSMDLARGWEAKITQANDVIANPSPTKGPGSFRQSTMSPPPVSTGYATPPSTSFQSVRSSPLVPSTSGSSVVTPSTTSRAQKRATVSGMDGFDASTIPDSTSSSSTDSMFRARPASISSYSSILSPHSTGDSSVTSNRSQATEDRLAKAKANALKRREAKAAASGLPIDTVKAIETIKTVSTPAGEVANAILTVKAPPTPSSFEATPVKGSPFASVFAKPGDEDLTPRKPASVSRDTPTSSRMSARNIFESPAPASTSTSGPSSTKPKYVPSGLSLGQPSVPTGLAPPAGSSSDKYGSISKTDRRRLGRHLPRIASGGEGWEGDETTERTVSGHPRVPSNLGRHSQPLSPSASKEEENIPPPSPSKPSYTSTTAPSRPRAAEVLAPSKSSNVPTPATPDSAPSTVSKRRSAYMSPGNKPELPSHVGVNAPRPEVAGEEMKGLMNAVGAMSVRGGAKDSAEGVTGKLCTSSIYGLKLTSRNV